MSKNSHGVIFGEHEGGGGLRSIRGGPFFWAGKPHAIDYLCKIRKKMLLVSF